MGTLRLLADEHLISPPICDRLFVTDFEGTPAACEAKYAPNSAYESLCEVQISIDGDQSFYLQVPFRTASGAETLIATATLRQRDQPYLLALELVRGEIHRLTNQNFEWNSGGFSLIDNSSERISEIMKRFTAVATIPHDLARCHRESIKLLPDVIELVYELSDGVTTELTKMNATAGIATLLGGNWQDQPASEINVELFKSAFDTAVIDLRWPTAEVSPGKYEWTRAKEQLEICNGHGLRTISAPLLDLSPSNIPGWMENWQSDPNGLANKAIEFAVNAVGELAGEVHLWNVTATMNQQQDVALNDQARLQLTADLVQRIRRLEPSTPILVSFEQPWGEYLLGQDVASPPIAPMRFADALVRAQIGVSALGLKLDLGSWPHGSVERSAMEVLRRLDAWSRFQLPLVVFLTAASTPVAASEGAAATTHALPTPGTQATTAKRMFDLLSAHPAVQGVVWNEWADRTASRFPTSGLVDAAGKPRQALNFLRELQVEQAAS